MIPLGSLVLLFSAGLLGVAFAADDGDGPLVMHGLYSYLADAGLFTDCRSGKSYPVAMEGDNVALERAYRAGPHAPGAALLVTLEGRIVERMPMEGPGPVPTLLPVRFLAISPGAGCVQQGDMSGPPVATVLGTGLQTRDPQELQYLIIQRLLDRYAQERGVVVNTAEIAAYQAEKQRFMDEDRRQRETRRTELAGQLQTNTLSGEQRSALAKELEVLDSLAGMERDMPAEDSAEMRAYAEQLARAFILQRKINRALHQQYGGRVIFQQLGPEPLDAYRTFLQEQAAGGNFRIFDAELEREFWRYFTTDSMHQFYPPGSAEEAGAFDQSVPASPAK